MATRTNADNLLLDRRETEELLALYGGILSELRAREVIRSENSPVGDYAEYLAAIAFRLSLAANSSIGYDGVDPQGVRYQVKARRITRWSRSRQLGSIRGLGRPTDPFDVLLGVLFNPDLSVQRAARIPVDVVRHFSKHQPYVNAWRFMLSDSVWLAEGVEDVTEPMVLALGKLAPR